MLVQRGSHRHTHERLLMFQQIQHALSSLHVLRRKTVGYESSEHYNKETLTFCGESACPTNAAISSFFS